MESEQPEPNSSQELHAEEEYKAGNKHPFILGLVITLLMSFVWLGVYLSSKTVSPYFVLGGYFFLTLIVGPLMLYYLQTKPSGRSSDFRSYLFGSVDISAIFGVLLILVLFFNFSI